MGGVASSYTHEDGCGDRGSQSARVTPLPCPILSASTPDTCLVPVLRRREAVFWDGWGLTASLIMVFGQSGLYLHS